MEGDSIILQVAYFPYAKDMSHPCDRRRLGMWSRETGNLLETSNFERAEVVVLSNACNFMKYISRVNKPVILDLVDGYLGARPGIIEDFGRNLARSFSRKSSIKWLTYNNHLVNACRKARAVVVASHEQREFILNYNKNVHVILDDHSELNSREHAEMEFNSDGDFSRKRNAIFWEGMGVNIFHFKEIALTLDNWLSKNDWNLHLVTEETFARYSTFIGKVKTSELIRHLFPKSFRKIKIIPWTLENVRKYSAVSAFAIIPIRQDDRFAQLKSENKLLSMWTLGLPAIVSKTPAYVRVARASNQPQICLDKHHWSSALDEASEIFTKNETNLTAAVTYLKANHSKEELVTKWNIVLKSVLQSNPDIKVKGRR
jgi:hypothetical protein